MKALVTGASGTVGGVVCERLLDRGDGVVGLSRDPERAAKGSPRVVWHAWDPTLERPPEEAFEGVDGVINLVGEPINQRWTDEAKRKILDSREKATHNLVGAILARAEAERPKVLVSQSAVGYYGARGDEVIDEEAEPGETFDARVCVAWEGAAHEVDGSGVRLAIIRTGLVLDPDSGLLEELLLPFKLGVGGPLAGGDQYMPWITLEDNARMIIWLFDTEGADGVYNGTAPEPVTNKRFSKALGSALGRPAILPVPKLATKIRFGGEFGEVVTKGQRAIPRRAEDQGFTFTHTEIEPALEAILD